MAMKELEYSHVSPPPGSVPTTSLNLTLFDIPMLGFFSMQRLYFYEFRHPTSYFMDNTLPNLKTSLSLTLQHFFPFAGKLSFPPPPQPLPYITYKEGDSPVPFIVNESTSDNFNHLIGDHPRHLEELRALVPKLPPLTMAPTGCREKAPLLAIQITVFPMAGICIGVAYCHGAADGRTASHFMKSWANTHRSKWDDQYLNNSLPIFDRDLIKNPSGFASKLFMIKREREELPLIPVDKLRVNFSIKRCQVMLLKDWIAKRWSDSEENYKRLSTFVVTCAYMWICLIKLQDIQSIKNATTDGALCHFIFSADCREHLKLPTTYFGNCIAVQYLSARKSEITGENGIVVAARTIGRRIMELEKAPLNGAEEWGLKGREIFNSGDHYASVISSPKLGYYKIDFGWGRPKKTDVTHIGINQHFSLIESGDEEGGVELGLTLSSHEFDSFNAIFYQGLSNLK